MSIAWSVLIIVAGGALAVCIYVSAVGREYLRDADELFDDMWREREALTAAEDYEGGSESW